MIALYEFIATGTQLKIEKPGKGCVATPVDSIEGPFVKLVDGRAMRVNDAKTIKEVASQIKKIIAVGDVLVTYGDFRKTNTPLLPTSYVEEYWQAQLDRAGFKGGLPSSLRFVEALELSDKYEIPMHPKYIYEYQDVSGADILTVAQALQSARVVSNGGSVAAVEHLFVQGPAVEKARIAIERLCIPHNDSGTEIRIDSDDAQSVLMSFGILDGNGDRRAGVSFGEEKDAVALINTVSPFKIMKRSTRIGGRIGRPEKAKERLMKTSINVLFPIGDYGGKERNITKAFSNSSRSFGTPKIEVDMARYRCSVGNEILSSFHCEKHNARGNVERRCRNCGNITMFTDECPKCKGGISGWEKRGVPLVEACNESMKRLGYQVMPKMMKGVRGLSNRNKVTEPLEKGILRSAHGVSIFKDGTARFDATDAPITHFYPQEIGTSVEILRGMGYDKDKDGRELVDPTQLVELKHHDVLLNRRGGEYLLRVAKFVDDLLVRFYKMEPFYRAQLPEDMVGQFVMTLSPHTSAGVLGRIIGFTDASVGFAHPYIICARRRNCDGDEDTMMLLLDALINFSRNYLPTTIGGTMDAPLIMAVHVKPEEVDDEVHPMEVTRRYGVDFYDKTYTGAPPGEAKVETVADRFGTEHKFDGLECTHLSGINALSDAPKRSMYTRLNNMDEKVKMQFKLMDILESIDKADTAKRLIRSHFVPDLVGNLHSFSKQSFRCISCNAKYRRVPLAGHCTRCGGKIVLTISRGGIQKYMEMAITLADRYNLDTYMKQNLMLIKSEIIGVFGNVEEQGQPKEQPSLTRFM
jgi:DNA polymerase II large subunit